MHDDDHSALMSWHTIGTPLADKSTRPALNLQDAIRDGLLPKFGRHALALTLNFNRPTTPNGGRVLIGRWLAMVDRKFLGSRFKKHPENRTKLIAIPEHMHSNLHYHAMCERPRLRNDNGNHVPVAEFETEATDIWEYLVASGSLCFSPMHHEGGWARYMTKAAHRDKAWDHAVLSWEFHSGK